MIWSVTHSEVYPSASASRAKSAMVLPAAYSHRWGSITPNCMVSPPLAPWARVVACLVVQADVSVQGRALGYGSASASCHRRAARLLGRAPAA